jgi:hypothetical protein
MQQNVSSRSNSEHVIIYVTVSKLLHGKPFDDVLTEDLKFALRGIGSEVMAERSKIDVSSSAKLMTLGSISEIKRTSFSERVE